MEAKEKHKNEARARILKALAHPSRIFIVDKLSNRPHCVSELTELIDSDTSTVSKHLSILKSAGLVEIRKEGTKVFYSLACPCVMTFIGCIETVVATNLNRDLSWLAPADGSA